jgi:hypothetical protein
LHPGTEFGVWHHCQADVLQKTDSVPGTIAASAKRYLAPSLPGGILAQKGAWHPGGGHGSKRRFCTQVHCTRPVPTRSKRCLAPLPGGYFAKNGFGVWHLYPGNTRTLRAFTSHPGFRAFVPAVNLRFVKGGVTAFLPFFGAFLKKAAFFSKKGLIFKKYGV